MCCVNCFIDFLAKDTWFNPSCMDASADRRHIKTPQLFHKIVKICLLTVRTGKKHCFYPRKLANFPTIYYVFLYTKKKTNKQIPSKFQNFHPNTNIFPGRSFPISPIFSYHAHCHIWIHQKKFIQIKTFCAILPQGSFLFALLRQK